MHWTKVILLLLAIILLHVSLASSQDPEAAAEGQAMFEKQMASAMAMSNSMGFGTDPIVPKASFMNKITWRTKKFFWKIFWILKNTINPLSKFFLKFPPSINYMMFRNIGVCDQKAGILGAAAGMAGMAGMPDMAALAG